MAECFLCIKKILKVVGPSIAARRQIPADLVDFLFAEKVGVDCRPNLKREIFGISGMECKRICVQEAINQIKENNGKLMLHNRLNLMLDKNISILQVI